MTHLSVLKTTTSKVAIQSKEGLRREDQY